MPTQKLSCILYVGNKETCNNNNNNTNNNTPILHRNPETWREKYGGKECERYGPIGKKKKKIK